MAITDDIFRGQDITFSITNRDENGVAIDLDTTSEIIVRLLDEGKNTIEKYNKVGTGGFRALDIPAPTNGITDIHLNAAQTDTAQEGTIIKAEIKMRFTNSDFDSSTQDVVTVVDNLGVIRKSQTIADL